MNERTLTFSGVTRNVLVFSALLATAIFAPYLGNQYITGPIVNATLLTAAVLLGTREALLIGIIPSLVALATGLLPAILAPQIPFIIMGNALLVTVFGMLRTKNYWLGMVTGGVVKFAFLFGMTGIITNLILNETVAAKVSAMLSWPQLVTALAGGILAYGVLKILRKA